MLESGYIRLYRSMLTWEWYGDINTKVLFLHLLLTVNYEPQKWRGIIVERGQRVASFSALSRETGLTIKEIRTSIEHLKMTGEAAHKATSKYGLFTIKNYDKYQIEGSQNGSQNGTQNGSQGAVEGQSEGNNGNKAKESNKSKKGNTRDKYQQIADIYNDTCVSFPKCTILSSARVKAISARFATGSTIDDFKTVFEKAQKSSFLKGANNRNWKATFDWLIKDSSMAKIIDGNFDNTDNVEMPKGRGFEF